MRGPTASAGRRAKVCSDATPNQILDSRRQQPSPHLPGQDSTLQSGTQGKHWTFKRLEQLRPTEGVPMPSLQQAFDQLALSSSSPAPSTDPHPSTFITKPLPSLPDGSKFTRCSSPDPGGWSGVVGRNDGLDARQAEFGLPRPPIMADRPPEQWKERVDPRSGQVNSHKRDGTGRLGSCDGPSSARHSMPAAPTGPHAGGPYRRHPFDPRLASSGPLGSTFASTSAVPSPPLYPMPGTTRPTRAELLNARFHPSPSSQNASSSLHTTPSNSVTPLVDPPSYSIFDSLAVGRPPIPPLSTRPTNLTPHIHTRPVSQTNPLSQPNAPNSSSTIANVRPSLQAAYSAPPTATRFVNSPAAPSTPCRRAQSSSQPSPSPSSPASPAKQCAGFTQKGQRCRNRLKSSSESGGDGYCRLHRTMILKETGVYVGGGGRTWVEFSGPYPSLLHPVSSFR